MKKSILAFAILFISVIASLAAHFTLDERRIEPTEETQIYLFGEMHGVKAMYDKEFEEWKRLYDCGARNLFLELPYYTAQYLNRWMQEEDDEILMQLMADLEGTASGNKQYEKLFRTIKKYCPETVFFGTDVGHQFDTTGMRYLKELEETGLGETDDYVLTKECILQGETFYTEGCDEIGYSPYREDCMVKNFLSAYERTGGGVVMGVYGSFHTNLSVDGIMANRLQKEYGDKLFAESVANRIVFGKPYALGFSYIGAIFLVMLFVPNLLWTKRLPKEYEKYSKNENKVLLAFERVGEVLCVVCAVLFKNNNLHIFVSFGGVMFSFDLLLLIISGTLMIFYEIAWGKYFASERTMKDFYKGFCGFPLALATLPVLAFFILGLYGQNLIMMGAAILLGIGHIGIHWGHYKEANLL